jgi:nucleoside-diphosphate-sugar epimerase
LLQFGAEHDLATVVIQPTIVYGPFCRPWTLTPITQLREGRVVLPGDKQGLCNPVYIDDVVNALILGAESPAAVGERFLISGPETIPWTEFYRAYEEMLGKRSVVFMSTAEIQELNRREGVRSTVRGIRLDPRKLLDWPPVRGAYEFARRHLIPESLAARAKQVLPSPLYVPNEVLLALYRARTVVRLEKARRLLGYQPAFDFDRGMALTARFVEWANLLTPVQHSLGVPPARHTLARTIGHP